MTSTRPKHIEASSDHLEVIEHQNAPCSLEPEPGQSPSAAMEKTALNHVSEDLMEQIVDFLVFTKTSEASRRVYDSIGRYLTRKLKLVINQQKSRTCSSDGVEFLGFIFHGYGGRMGVSPKNKKKFKDRVKEITRRNRGVRISSRFKELRQYFHGWVGYFRNGLAKTQLTDLDQWVRRRIRACYWKQWRRIRTKIRQLIKLGVRPTEAISHGCSSKGAWVMSSSHALHAGLSIDYLTQQGLASLLDIWSKFASKKRTA